MPLRLDAPLRISALSLVFFLACLPARAGGYLDAPGVEKEFAPFGFVEGGMNFFKCPQAGVYYAFLRSWQAGLEIRSWGGRARSAYDFIPETDLHMRTLWLGSEESEPLRNSEYVDLSLGFYPSYEFLSLDKALCGRQDSSGACIAGDEPRGGLRVQGRITLGKYWMPFHALDLGLDANISLGHYDVPGLFDSHPPGMGRTDYVTATVSVFWRR
jgi:hypothetical protein